ncbi:MAG TPA: calcium/proton exchanger [Ktedonobacterales bacterium]|nr:calcium/proton exchanger [Ktedonobacterales bacterium]
MPPWLYLLILALPGALVSEWLHASPLLTFILAALGVIPLAGLIGEATEALSERVGPMVGGLLNATFGNAAEFIIGVSALAAGLPDVVRAAIAGGIIGNALFTLGSAMLAGGWRYGLQRFQARNAGQYALMLALAVIGLAVPSLLATVGAGVTSGTNAVHGLALHEMSLIVAPLLLLSYMGYLAFSVFGVRAERRHPDGVAPREDEHREGDREDDEVAAGETSDEQVGAVESSHAEEGRGVAGMIARWRRASPLFDILTLVVATALISVDSELLTGAIEPLSKNLHLSTFFVGLIVLPLVGGAAEFATAIRTAMSDHMESTLSVTAGSSIQIALLIAPLLILISPFVGSTLDLDFSQLELVIFGLVAGLFALISLDGESTWLEGLQLCVFYLIVAVGAFFIPG